MKHVLTSAAVIFLFAQAGQGAMQSTVSSNSITWTFDQQYECGQFVNGDWWVKGPATVQSVSPAPAGGRHGSMVNPSAAGQAYDSRVAGYNAGLGVSYPKVLQGGQSLVSTESHTTTGCHNDLMGVCVAEAHSYLKRAAVLTCVSTAPAATAFRPAFCGSDKKIYDSANLNRGLLPKLAPLAGTPSAATYTRYFRYPWLHQVPDWQGRMVHPTENMPNYYREAYMIYSETSLLMLLDVAGKEELLINFVQYGIDTHSSTRLGLGDRHTCKWPILFAGIMLGETALQSSSYGGFREIWGTYYGTGWHGGTVLWDATPQYEHVHPSQWQNFSTYPQFQNAGGADGACKLETYRHCCSSHTWPGMAMAIKFFPGAKELYAHNAFFDYVDRWMTEDLAYLREAAAPVCGAGYVSGWTGKSAGSNFASLMWIYYRDQATAVNNPAGMRTAPRAVLDLKDNPHYVQNGPLLFGFHITETQGVRVSVLSLSGEEIAVLHDRPLNSGRHGLVWADPLPGIRLVRITTPAGDKVKKVSILK